ncbi:RNA polymerase sigma factor [Chitinophaga sp. XS-30]|uniref:RNA polymerase sigma factor n=1 Tax=Chitinophaga sp. XS-30 TaxID=2604421 RepID=UPI0011DE23A0|nr:sigma-70 family RNA polymerase sigma factor [Chitinophaga sp. XS-30]QEH40100.1 sigma-70 family RNA polymerase sigma factor [Chitinophaga sp. XS-30]
MYTALSDSELFLRVKQDDHRAFNEIHRRYWEKLMAISLQRVKDADTAKDIMQEVFISLWNNRHKTDIEKLENYLATAVKYLSLAYLRSGKKMRLIDEALPETLPDDVSVDQLLYTKDLLAIILEETNTLPPVRQLVFRYSRLEGYTIREIAYKLDLSPFTVKSHLTKALSHFRKVLKVITILFKI